MIAADKAFFADAAKHINGEIKKRSASYVRELQWRYAVGEHLDKRYQTATIPLNDLEFLRDTFLGEEAALQTARTDLGAMRRFFRKTQKDIIKDLAEHYTNWTQIKEDYLVGQQPGTSTTTKAVKQAARAVNNALAKGTVTLPVPEPASGTSGPHLSFVVPDSLVAAVQAEFGWNREETRYRMKTAMTAEDMKEFFILRLRRRGWESVTPKKREPAFV